MFIRITQDLRFAVTTREAEAERLLLLTALSVDAVGRAGYNHPQLLSHWGVECRPRWASTGSREQDLVCS